MKRRVSPPLASRTAATSCASPGTKRSSPIRSSGPLGTSRMPVASTTSAAGRPRAKQRYHSSTSGVPMPSEPARQGTMAGTQVRALSTNGPTFTGENSRERAASAASGQGAPTGSWRMRSGGRHTGVLGPLGNDGGGLDLDLGLSLHESHHLHDAHGGAVPDPDIALGSLPLLQLRVVLGAARDEPGEAHDVFGARTAGLEHRAHILQCLAHLLGENCAREAPLSIPAHLPGDEHLQAAHED